MRVDRDGRDIAILRGGFASCRWCRCLLDVQPGYVACRDCDCTGAWPTVNHR